MTKKLRLLCVSVFFCAAVPVLFTGCASVPDPVRERVVSADYAGALSYLDTEKSSVYTERDKVLYALDTGILAYYAGNYGVSTERFSTAEQLIYDYYAKSITQSIGSFLVNDTVVDYAGEDYEDIYTNLFMALNYLNLGDMESAFVEIRRFDNKQKSLSVKYSKQIAEAKKSAAAGNGVSSSVEFHNSALARYISMLMYRTAGDPDSARIDAGYIQSAFETQKNLYPFPVPASVSAELQVPSDKARLNIIGFSGLAPKKVEYITRYATGRVNGKLALPDMVRQPSDIGRIRVIAADAYGFSKEFNLEPIESIENIAIDTFNQRRSLLYFKALARSLSKTATQVAFDEVSRESDDSAVSLVFSMLSLASSVTTEVTERADLRTSRYFPANASVGGVTLDPGVYSVSIVYIGKSGRIVSVKKYDSVEVSAGKLNLLEAVCLD